MPSAEPAAATDRCEPPPFEVVEAALPASLSGIVTRITGYRETMRRDLRTAEPASLVVPLVISFGEPFLIGLGREPGPDDRFGSFAAGLFAGPVMIGSSGASSCIQIDFTPTGARRFFGLPMSDLANGMVPLGDVLGSQGIALRERLGNVSGWSARLDLAMSFICERLGGKLPAIPVSVQAYAMIHLSGGRLPVSRLAKRLGISRKHLAACFREDVGLGPKAVARIVRFQRALRLVSSNRLGLAMLAAECGFSDQAHMTREFTLLGVAPPSRTGLALA